MGSIIKDPGIHKSPAKSSVPRQDANLRDWSRASYSAVDGRAVTSIGDEYGRGGPPDSSDHCRGLSAQIPSGFEGRDRRATQNPTPVRKRPYTQAVD